MPSKQMLGESFKYKAPKQLGRLKRLVIKLQLVGVNGPYIFTDVDEVLKEVRVLLTADNKKESAIEMDVGDKITLTIDTMSLRELDNLPEFQGY